MYANENCSFPAPIDAAPHRVGLAAAVAHVFVAPFARWKQARADALAVEALGSMDQHLLRDIGVDRDDFARLVRDGRR